MYKEYWGLKEFPFENVPDPRFFWSSPEHEEALVRLFYTISNRKGAAMLTGEIGSGKTLLSRTLVKALGKDKYEIGLIANPTLSPIDFLKEILYQLGVKPKADDKLELLHALSDSAVNNIRIGKNTVVIVDEAQSIKDDDILEELRLLLNFQLNNQFLLTLVLIGQPEFRERVAKIKQLEQRIAIKYHLNNLNLENTKNYINFRLKKAGAQRKIFTDVSTEALYRYSLGLPREINNLCDMSLLFGFSDKVQEIDLDIVGKVADTRK